MSIRVDIQRNADLDSDVDYPASAWFDSVPRVGEVVQFRSTSGNGLQAHRVIGVNYVESEPDHFRALIVVE